MRKTSLAYGLLLSSFGFAVNYAVAEDAPEASGEELFKFHGCVNCHGADGKNPVSKLVPVLAGK